MDDRSLSKLLSYVLRHNPAELGLELDGGGWVRIDDVCEGLSERRKIAVNATDLEWVNSNANKLRFEFKGDRMRALSGHSVPVDLGYSPTEPPDILYHGTATRFLDSILTGGIHRMKRHDVHLSAEIDVAVEVGSRHGKPVVIAVDAARMHRDGMEFHVTPQRVWLVRDVPAVYLMEVIKP